MWRHIAMCAIEQNGGMFKFASAELQGNLGYRRESSGWLVNIQRIPREQRRDTFLLSLKSPTQQRLGVLRKWASFA